MNQAAWYKKLLVAALFFLGCYWAKYKKNIEGMNDPNRIMLFGYLDTAAAPFKIKLISLKKLNDPMSPPRMWFPVEDSGHFFGVDLTPGLYQIDCLQGSSYGDTVTSCFDKDTSNETAIQTKDPGVYYIGSWKYVDYKDKILVFNVSVAFDLARVRSPTAEEILLELYPKLKPTRWYDVVTPFVGP
jgi:hypothetical protein